jgi:hypothetical protein
MGAELFHADGQTDGEMTRLIVNCHNFANAPKINIKSLYRFKVE